MNAQMQLIRARWENYDPLSDEESDAAKIGRLAQAKTDIDAMLMLLEGIETELTTTSAMLQGVPSALTRAINTKVMALLAHIR